VFHIHIDASEISPEIETFATSTHGFRRTDFAGGVHTVECYAPLHHLTMKTESASQFREAFDSLTQFLERGGGLVGYLEGEFVASDVDITAAPFDSAVDPPFCLQSQSLPPNTFRESEIHITLSDQDSHPELHRRLRAMGLIVASIQKLSGPARIYTAQGSRAQIDSILPSLTTYLETAGGSAACSIKEERVVAWWKSAPELPLPPVIGRILPFDEGSPANEN
jgi:hypothetical protein